MLCGSYQTGKSSTIKMLTGDKNVDIQTGDGVIETTRGAYVYGPYLYNDIRERFGFPRKEGDNTQAYFVDTEGCNGFLTGNNPESNTYLLSQLIAPYALLSNVLVATIKKDITQSEFDAMATMYGIIDSIRKGRGLNNTFLMGLVPNVDKYFPDKNFDEKQSQITNAMQKKFGKFKLHEFMPLPQFDTDYDILEQSLRFKEGFKIFAQNLIQQIDISQDQLWLIADGV